MEKKPITEQGPQEKVATPWRVRFTCGKPKPTYTDIRKDLLNACWGNNKMADLLYHFLVVGSWEAHNNHIGEATKKVIVQETHAKIQTKVKVSEPTLVSHLKAFAGAGYVRKASYRGAFEVDFDAIEKAFSDAPSKHSTSQPKTDDLSLNLSLSQEVKELREEVQKLREQMQDLSLTLVSFKFQHAQSEGAFKFNLSLPLVSANCDEAATAANLAHIFKFAETKELYLNESWGLASVAGLRGENLSKNILDIRDIRDLDKESERRSVALASQSHAQSQDVVVEEPYVPDNLSQFTEMSPVLQARINTVLPVVEEAIDKITTSQEKKIDDSYSLPTETQGYTQAGEVSTLTIPQQGGNRAYRSTDSVDHSSGVRGDRTQRRDERPTTPGTPASHGKDQSAERRAQVVQEALLSVQKPLTAKAKKALLEAQVDRIFDVLDAVRTEAEEDPRATYARSQADQKRLADLIKANERNPDKVAPDSLRMAWMELWNRPVDTRTGFDWKAHMTIPSFCNNFDSALSCALRKSRNPGKGKKQSKSEEYDPYSLAGLLAEQNPGFFESSY